MLERPCRTLFVRNITVRALFLAMSPSEPDLFSDQFADDYQYEAEVERVRASFASYGEIKTFFDMIPRRGMVFITYVRH